MNHPTKAIKIADRAGWIGAPVWLGAWLAGYGALAAVGSVGLLLGWGAYFVLKYVHADRQLALTRRALGTVAQLDEDSFLDSLDANMRSAGTVARDALKATA